MKTILYALFAVALYASQNTILERKLAYVSPLIGMICWYLGILVIAVPLVLFRNQLGMAITMPQPSHYWLMAMVGVMLFFADFAFLSAYHGGGSVAQVATIVALFPAIAVLIKFLIGGGTPSLSQAIGLALVPLVVYLVSK